MQNVGSGELANCNCGYKETMRVSVALLYCLLFQTASSASEKVRVNSFGLSGFSSTNFFQPSSANSVLLRKSVDFEYDEFWNTKFVDGSGSSSL
jgi:hypothetical protein